MTHNEELIGGCCVCSDDQGFSNNALVYCDGKDCKVACHTACYGIVSIPDGDWYCRRCESGENHASCRLCPMIEGAMKRTMDNNWAHVICALYIPEVSFGNDQTMEPIILSKIPSTRYGQMCSLCIKNGRTKTEAMQGACCECNMKNCSQIFHVTCAQQAGFLYEDVRKNTCQYPIYCEEHQPKFSKFIRQIPPFHYKSSSEKKLHSKSSQLSDFIHKTNGLLIENKINETSQTNSSQSIELNQNQSIIDNRESSISTSNNLSSKKSSIPKIKIEENEIDYQIIDKTQLNKDNQIRKKRQHSIEEGRRPVGRPPKKSLLLQQKPPAITNSTSSIEQTSRSDRTQINFYPRRPLTDTSKTTTATTTQQTRSFPPETLEEFLEQEWESSSDFLLQQTMPHDVSSLLSCLYQFKSENAALEKQYDQLKHRRDSLRLTNVNLRQKILEITSINDSQRLPTKNSHKSTKHTSSEMEYFPTNSSSSSSLPYAYPMIKNERISSTNGLSIELLSQILATNGSQLFAPTWNISNFGYANFPGANSVSVTDDSILRSYSSFDQQQ